MQLAAQTALPLSTLRTWERGVKVPVETMSRAMRKLGWTFKKVVGGLRVRQGGAKRLARTSERHRPQVHDVRGRVLDQPLIRVQVSMSIADRCPLDCETSGEQVLARVH